MGGFVHLELSTDNLKKAKGFYSKVFGWKFDDMNMSGADYSMVKGQMAPGIGLQKAPMPDMPSSWIAYVDVPDVKKAVAKAAKAGATITVPYFSVPGYGEGAWMIDPTGAPVAIWHSFAPKASTKKRSKKKATKKKAAKKKVTKKKTKKKAAKKTAKKQVKKKSKRKTKATKKRAKKRR